MMPARVAMALQADGWWLRSEIIWHKPNPMPESVRDRPTSSHEKVYLMSKSARYFYDADAVRVARVPHSPTRGFRPMKGGSPYINRNGPQDDNAKGFAGTDKWDDMTDAEHQASGAKLRNVLEIPETPVKQRGHDRVHEGFRDRWDGMTKAEQQAGGASMRNVMKVATHAFREAHFATFPPKLDRAVHPGGDFREGLLRGLRGRVGAGGEEMTGRVQGTARTIGQTMMSSMARAASTTDRPTVAGVRPLSDRSRSQIRIIGSGRP